MLAGFVNLNRHAELSLASLAARFPTASSAVKGLEDQGLVTEMTGQKKNWKCSCRAYVALLIRCVAPAGSLPATLACSTYGPMNRRRREAGISLRLSIMGRSAVPKSGSQAGGPKTLPPHLR